MAYLTVSTRFVLFRFALLSFQPDQFVWPFFLHLLVGTFNRKFTDHIVKSFTQILFVQFRFFLAVAETCVV